MRGRMPCWHKALYNLGRMARGCLITGWLVAGALPRGSGVNRVKVWVVIVSSSTFRGFLWHRTDCYAHHCDCYWLTKLLLLYECPPVADRHADRKLGRPQIQLRKIRPKSLLATPGIHHNLCQTKLFLSSQNATSNFMHLWLWISSLTTVSDNWQAINQYKLLLNRIFNTRNTTM